MRCRRSFRDALSTGHPAALIRDPENGQTLKLLNPSKWRDKNNFGNPGFSENFVGLDHLMQPGPNTYLKGALRPVFFDKADFDKWLESVRTQPAEPSLGSQETEGHFIALPECEPEGRERKAAWRALMAAYPDGRVPLDIKTAKALSLVNSWLSRNRNTASWCDKNRDILPIKAVSRETVARLLDRKP
jgi:hypothetical protein